MPSMPVPSDDIAAEVAHLRAQLAESAAREAALAADNAMLRAVIDGLPDGVSVIDARGEFVLTNRAAVDLLRMPAQDGGPDAWIGKYGIFGLDGETAFPPGELPLARALGGESTDGVEMLLRNAATPEGIVVSVSGRPWRGADGRVLGGIASFRDVTRQKELERDLEERNRSLHASEEEKQGLIERLRGSIEELSTPILEVWNDVLAMPIIGVVDSKRSSDIVQRLLAELVRSQARFVLLDLTGVEVVDTGTADHFLRLVKAVELIGARCILTGIRPGVAQTLVQLGVDFGTLQTLRTLKHGLRECLRAMKDAGIEGSEKAAAGSATAPREVTRTRDGARGG